MQNLCLEDWAFIVYTQCLLPEVLFLPRHLHFDDGGAGGNRQVTQASSPHSALVSGHMTLSSGPLFSHL